jgi:hypothetical protein
MVSIKHNGVNNLEDKLQSFGVYNSEEKCLYLNNNKHLQNAYLTKLVKDLKIKIQLDLFT